MRWIALTLAAIAVLILSTSSHAATGPTVYFNDQSKYVTPAQVADALPAFQAAVTGDLGPAWDVAATLSITHPVPGDWTVNLTDATPPCWLEGCVLGYHDIRHGIPYAVVYAAQSRIDGVSVQEVESHELFEMLVDPTADRAIVEHGDVRIAEVCDPVVEWSWFLPSATGKRVRLSDFVTPAWFEPGGQGPFDLARKLSAPRELGKSGYTSNWVDGAWQTIFAPGFVGAFE